MPEYPAVLVLNASYEALNLVSWQHAIVLLVQGKASVHQLHDSGAIIHSQHLAIALPAVIVLTHYALVPYRELDEHAAASTTAVMRRDKNTCGYCGAYASTVDHILPRSRGGPRSWVNLIAACLTCNQLKGDRTVEQAGMRLLWQPRAPSRDPDSRRIWKELPAVV